MLLWAVLGQQPPLLRGEGGSGRVAAARPPEPRGQGRGAGGRGAPFARELLKAASPWHWTRGAKRGLGGLNGKSGKSAQNTTDGGSGKAC